MGHLLEPIVFVGSPYGGRGLGVLAESWKGEGVIFSLIWEAGKAVLPLSDSTPSPFADPTTCEIHSGIHYLDDAKSSLGVFSGTLATLKTRVYQCAQMHPFSLFHHFLDLTQIFPKSFKEAAGIHRVS
jgi:hypothetical protein